MWRGYDTEFVSLSTLYQYPVDRVQVWMSARYNRNARPMLYHGRPAYIMPTYMLFFFFDVSWFRITLTLVEIWVYMRVMPEPYQVPRLRNRQVHMLLPFTFT